MTNNIELKYAIRDALYDFNNKPMSIAATSLLNTLGYRSDKRIELQPNNEKQFRAEFDPQKKLNGEKALVGMWSSVDVLFQITDDEIQESMGGQPMMFASNRVDGAIINSYLFFAIQLKEREKAYTRTELANITREVNKLFFMPVMIMFRHGDTISLSIIRRRLNKRDESRDVLEKVTLVKDIRLHNPLRAHIEILADFHLEELDKDFRAQNFVQLHAAWERRLGTYTLNERFYHDIANWYFAALQDKRIIYPRNVEKEDQRSMYLIRLLTRLIFCWFLQEKDLIPTEIFSRETGSKLLKDFSSQAGTYYRGILQNLFFATLNQPQEDRGFRYKNPSGRDGNRGASNLYRYVDLFNNSKDLLGLFERVPFLNGGLFECLDTVYKKEEKHSDERFDDFSEEKGNNLYLPNDLFFEDKGHQVDLSKIYDDARKRRETTRGLIDILDSYKFTIEENTPLEEEIALDPELLGKVFENLLASYNDETKTTARKATGSFYTPREIVSYMVDETLLAYLHENVPDVPEADLRTLFITASQDYHNSFTSAQTTDLIAALDNVRVLDPACGSGAFPMGALQRMVDLLVKLDPNNARWKQKQLEKAERDRLRADEMEDENIRKSAKKESSARVEDIQHSFDTRHHELDFARKLYVIENCIYGVDIQPIAIQIAKLRFFITLVVDQKTDHRAPNQGVRPLPNLETKLVAADSLFPLPRPKEAMMSFGDFAVRNLREQLRQVRHEYFRARTPEKKAECRQEDKSLRKEIAKQLKLNGWDKTAAEKLADWDPYDPNAEVPNFLEPEWMFGGLARPAKPAPATLRGAFSFINEAAAGQMEMTPPAGDASDEWRFDIVIGNPPYVHGGRIAHLKERLKPLYECYTGTADLYVYFYERGIKLLRPGGAFAFITSNKWMRSAYGEGLRGWLVKNTHLHHIIDFGDEPIFTALAYPCIITLTKRVEPARATSSEVVNVLNWQSGWDTTQFTEVLQKESFTLPQIELSGEPWQIVGKSERQLMVKLENAGQLLDNYIDGKLYRGLVTGLNEAFVVDRATRDRLVAEHSSSARVLKPFLRGRDIKRWNVDNQDLWLLYIPWHFPLHTDDSIKGASQKAEREFIRQYPAIYNHLLQFKSALKNRNKDETGVRYEWYALQRWGSDYWKEFDKQLIVWGNLTVEPKFSFASPGTYISAPASMIVSDSKYLLGILNSTVTKYFIGKSGATRQGGFLEYKPMYVSRMPIPNATKTQQAIIAYVVDIILLMTSPRMSIQSTKYTEFMKLSSRAASFENLLNGLVYELFFPSEFQEANLHLFDLVAKATLPNLKPTHDVQYLLALQSMHDKLFLGDHPIRSALFNLRGLEFVRIIEAEEPNNSSSAYETSED